MLADFLLAALALAIWGTALWIKSREVQHRLKEHPFDVVVMPMIVMLALAEQLFPRRKRFARRLLIALWEASALFGVARGKWNSFSGAFDDVRLVLASSIAGLAIAFVLLGMVAWRQEAHAAKQIDAWEV